MSHWEGIEDATAWFDGLIDQADSHARTLVLKGAAMVEAKEKANFEGSHPRGAPHVGGSKPNVVSGAARRSIRADPIIPYGPADYGMVIGPRVIYARRLELGFTGQDSLGRNYNQPPYPYVRPAILDLEPELQAMARAEWVSML